VITNGLRLKERLERGDELDLADEQAKLKKLLRGADEARRYPDYGGHAADPVVPGNGTGQAGSDQFLGSRYALVCWLDEIFSDSAWSAPWKEQTLESALYGTNDRQVQFWAQARRAESGMQIDALEVFYLCVMLGFRGAWRGRRDKLKAWRDAIVVKIGKGKVQRWRCPPECHPATYVPPLRGREHLRRVLLSLGLFLGLLIPAVMFSVVHNLGN
jgi:type IV/VI secretion system ImpK/VasF family protein